MVIVRSLPSTPDAPALARDALEDLAPQVPDELLLDLRLLVSEVVTNAVRHAASRPGQEVRLKVERRSDAVRVEVEDEGPGFDVDRPEPNEQADGGWGLYMLDKVAARWGTRPCVWFELAL